MRRALLALALALGLAAPATAAPVDLEGTWYVLVHYTDDNAANAEAMRWEDHVWVFERKGGKLEWKDYPIVIFDDDTGRFERSRSGYSRVVGAWEPSADQLQEIRQGLEVNTRGSRTKTLTGSDAEGWSTGGRSQPQAANYVTFSQTWTVKDLDGKPVISQEDVLGNASMGSMSGRTVFQADTVAPDEIRGKFERDGTRHGSFRMLRAGAASHLGTGGKTPNEKQRERIESQIREALGQEGGGEIDPERLNRKLDELEQGRSAD